MMTRHSIWMGWDSREVKAYTVARHSIISRTKDPLSIVPLKLEHMPANYIRPIERKGAQMFDVISDAPMSTEFAISRFMVPHLQPSGWALFCDCDILCWSDISELFALADPRFAVLVVKHRIPEPLIGAGPKPFKMDGQIQTYYARKNWSSVILWNCDHEGNKRLTMDLINSMPGCELHAFCWLRDDEIGELPRKWNQLVDVDFDDVTGPFTPFNDPEGIWHLTLGGVWLPNWQGGSADEQWKQEAIKANL